MDKPNPTMTLIKDVNYMSNRRVYHFRDIAQLQITQFYNIIITNNQVNQNSYLLATKAKKIIKKTSNTI